MQPKGKPQFNALTYKYNGRAARVVTDVGVTPAFDPNQYKNENIPYEITKKNALWDTGATRSVITSETVKELNLVPAGAAEVVHFGGKQQTNTYLVNFYFPEKVIVYGVLVSESNLNSGFGVIIGMDIITQGDFAITNVNNLTWLSYRIPSIQAIDYALEANRIRYAGSNKYGPCPCGKKDENGKPVRLIDCHWQGL